MSVESFRRVRVTCLLPRERVRGPMKVRKRPEQKHTQAHRIVLGRCESRAPRLPPLYKRDLWEVGRWEVGCGRVGRWEGGRWEGGKVGRMGGT